MRQILDQNFNDRCSQGTTPSVSITSGILGLSSRAWMPLAMQQMSGQNLSDRYTHVGIPTISNLP